MSESNHHTCNDLQVAALILDVELWCVDSHVVVAVTEQRGHGASRLGGGGPGGVSRGGSRGRVAEATSRCLEPDPATTELTVWETRGAIWETTWLTTSSLLDTEPEVWAEELLEVEAESWAAWDTAGRLLLLMAPCTVWLTRGWIWLTTLDTMSEVREEEEEEEEDCWLLPLENPELEPKLEDELRPEEPVKEEEEKPDEEPAEDEDTAADCGLSLIWTKLGLTSLVSV